MLLPVSTTPPLSPSERVIVAHVVDQAPPLSQSTKARLAALLRPSGPRDSFVSAVRDTIGGVA